MTRPGLRRVVTAVALSALEGAALAATPPAARPLALETTSAAELIAPGVASSEFSEVRLAVSPDGNTMLWGSTNRPGGPGGWDIWVSRQGTAGWSKPQSVSFNSVSNDFDPAFSPDGRYVYFFSNRPGGAGGDDLYRVPVTPAGFSAV